MVASKVIKPSPWPFTPPPQNFCMIENVSHAPQPPSQPRALPNFQITSVIPPKFTGAVKKKPAHEIQVEIDSYLHNMAQEQAWIYGFRADNEDPQYNNHKSYVDWISTGLSGVALSRWRLQTPMERYNMTFSQYFQWIRKEFTPELTLTKVMNTLDNLKQTGSCRT